MLGRLETRPAGSCATPGGGRIARDLPRQSDPARPAAATAPPPAAATSSPPTRQSMTVNYSCPGPAAAAPRSASRRRGWSRSTPRASIDGAPFASAPRRGGSAPAAGARFSSTLAVNAPVYPDRPIEGLCRERHAFLPSRLQSLNWAAPHRAARSFCACAAAARTSRADHDRSRAQSSSSPAAWIRWSPPALAREAGFRLLALTVDYNQRHRIELEAAARIAAALGAERHIVLPLDLSRFGGSALTADIAVPERRASATTSRSPTCPRATPSSSRSAWAGPRRRARATSSSASTRSIIRAIPIAGPTSSPPSRRWPTSPPRRASRASASRSTRRCSHMTKADIVREAARLGLDAGHELVLLRSGARTAAIAACATAAGCAPRASPKRACPIRPATRRGHELRGQGDLPDPAGRGDAGGPARRLPALRRLQSVDRAASRTGPTAQCNFCDTDFVGMDGENGGRYEADALAGGSRRLWGEGERPLVVDHRRRADAPARRRADRRAPRAAASRSRSRPTAPCRRRPGIDWICVSPKAGHRGGPALGRRAQAGLAAGRDRSRGLLGWDFRHFLIQPMDCADARGARTAAAIDYVHAPPALAAQPADPQAARACPSATPSSQLAAPLAGAAGAELVASSASIPALSGGSGAEPDRR